MFCEPLETLPSGYYCYDELLVPVIPWDFEGTVCTGGTNATFRRKLRFHRTAQKLNPNAICSVGIHQCLALQTLPYCLNDGLNFVTQAIDLNLAKTKNRCVFKAPCKKMDV
jgi:hypothetical protein